MQSPNFREIYFRKLYLKKIKLRLVKESKLSLNNLALKADAIHLELFTSNVSCCQRPNYLLKLASPDRAPDSTRTSQVNSFYRLPNRYGKESSSCSNCINHKYFPDLCWYYLKYGHVNAKNWHSKPCLHLSKGCEVLATTWSRKPRHIIL